MRRLGILMMVIPTGCVVLAEILIVALYRHYKSNRDIFDCIVQRMEQQIELSCILVPILCMLVVCI